MARSLIVYLLLAVFVFLVIISSADGRRGGGGARSSSRSSRSRGGSFSSARGARSYSNVPLTGRVLGSSTYNMMTWRTAAMAGLIYGGSRYVRLHSHRHDMPPICTNNYEKSPEGRVYGYFICPRENETETYIYCCGPSKREFCCDREMAQKYVSRRSGLSIGGIVGIVVGVGIICVLVFVCCKKRKQAGLIIRKFTGKDGGVKLPGHNHDNQSVPLNGSAPAYDGFTPSMPPPSYDAVAAQPSYEHISGLPYGPPQPQPPPNCDEKPGLPAPAAGDAALPYWSPYPQPGADQPSHYPNETSAANAPYPPPFELGYPNPGVAPYPPADGAPYPHAGEASPTYPGGATYPTPSAPYPLSDEAPYPPPGEASYPPPAGAPYSTQGGAPYPSYNDNLRGVAK